MATQVRTLWKPPAGAHRLTHVLMLVQTQWHTEARPGSSHIRAWRRHIHTGDTHQEHTAWTYTWKQLEHGNAVCLFLLQTKPWLLIDLVCLPCLFKGEQKRKGQQTITDKCACNFSMTANPRCRSGKLVASFMLTIESQRPSFEQPSQEHLWSTYTSCFLLPKSLVVGLVHLNHLPIKAHLKGQCHYEVFPGSP